jgi:hypothetical protein
MEFVIGLVSPGATTLKRKTTNTPSSLSPSSLGTTNRLSVDCKRKQLGMLVVAASTCQVLLGGYQLAGVFGNVVS